jgi:hypothetical protein
MFLPVLKARVHPFQTQQLSVTPLPNGPQSQPPATQPLATTGLQDRNEQLQVGQMQG